MNETVKLGDTALRIGIVALKQTRNVRVHCYEV